MSFPKKREKKKVVSATVNQSTREKIEKVSNEQSISMAELSGYVLDIYFKDLEPSGIPIEKRLISKKD